MMGTTLALVLTVIGNHISGSGKASIMTNKGWIAQALLAAGLGASPAEPAAASGAVPSPTKIGISLASPARYRRSRAFANLVIGSSWGSRLPELKDKVVPDLDADGNPRSLPGGAPLWHILYNPNATTLHASIKCTFRGHGELVPTMGATNIRKGVGGFTFDWDNSGSPPKQVALKLTAIDQTDPLHDLDCRETNMSPAARFDPKFVEYLRGYAVIRFMDWQATNKNAPVTWAGRHTTKSIEVLRDDGVAIEDMVALSNQVGADPWFNMPWNADDDYISRFAKLVHDTLAPDRTVYVELGNEVWNLKFLMSKQATREGLAANLDANPNAARMHRFAIRLVEVMDIWKKAYADRPRMLVRVAATQNGPHTAEQVLGYRDTADHVDMLATAPYFAYDFTKNPPADPDAAFARMEGAIDTALAGAAAARKVAIEHGKRYGAYEAGQHIVLNDLELEQRIQRDPRMYQAYRNYIGKWRSNIGDLVVMYNSAEPIVRYGGWGLAEYLGQPLAEAPKLRAVRDELGH